MKAIGWTWGVAMAVCLVAVPAVGAPLATDPLAMPAWRGTANFSASDATYTFDVDVDYAVYAAGQYPGNDPSGGTMFVYAYEVLNTVNAASVDVSALLVGLAHLCGACSATWDTSASAPGMPGGVVPDSGTIGATSARWTFLTDGVDYGEDSLTLLYASPSSPHWMTASVANGGLSDEALLPSPMPEPATLGLLGAGAWALVLLRRQRR